VPADSGYVLGMRRLEAIHAVVAILLASSVSCGQTTRYVKTVPTAQLQARIAECVQTTGEKACLKLCQEVFPESSVAQCTVEQNGANTDVWYEKHSTSTSSEPSEPGCAPGRRPTGLCGAPRITTIASYLAWAAQMEAASVTAFARVHRHLETLDAPETLRARVRDAIADELAHAHAMVALARRYGATPTPPVISDPGDLPLLARAIENATEGCVGEAVAAIHAAFLATHATDPVVRDTFAAIATDEAEHARLSYALAAEYARHLDTAERAQVLAAYHTALLAPALRTVTPALAALGIPDDGSLARTVDHVLASLAPSMTSYETHARAL
jgi:hypothetical protein